MKKNIVALGIITALNTTTVGAQNKELNTTSLDTKDRVSQVVGSNNTGISYLEWCAKNQDECQNSKIILENGKKQNPEVSLNNESGFNLSGNSSTVGGVIKVNGQTIYLGFENISGTDILLKAEYKYVGNDFGTLITIKSGNGHKSVFITGKYNGLDYSIKSTAGYLEKDYKGANIGQAFLGLEGEKKLDQNYSIGAHLSLINTQSKELPGTRITSINSSISNNNIYTVTDTTEITRWQEFAGDKGRVNAGLFGQYISDDSKDKTRLGVSGNNGTDDGYYGNVNYSHITSDGKTKIGTELSSDENVRFSIERIISNTGATISAYISKISGKEVLGVGLNIPLDNAPNKFKHSSPGLDKDVTHVTGANEASSVLFGKEVAIQEIKSKQVIDVVPAETVQNINYTILGGIATFTFTARSGFRYYSVISGSDSLISGNSFTVDVSAPGEYKIGIYEVNPYDNSKGIVSYRIINILDIKPTQPTVSGATTVTVGNAMNLTFSSTDPEGNAITYSVIGTIPSGTTFNSNGTLTGTTNTTQSGSFQVVANDGSLNSNPITVNYNIEALPLQSLSITTSGPVVSGADSDNMVADNGPLTNVEVSLSVNSPYTLSSSSLTFTPNVGLQTQTVNVLHNGNVVGTRTISVTWQ